LVGVSGPVNIYIRPGVYTDRPYLKEIPGVSAINNIKVTSSSGSANSVRFEGNVDTPVSFFIIGPHVIVSFITVAMIANPTANYHLPAVNLRGPAGFVDNIMECIGCVASNHTTAYLDSNGEDDTIKRNVFKDDGQHINIRKNWGGGVIAKNVIEGGNIGISGLYNYTGNKLEILDNYIETHQQGIYMERLNGIKIMRNQIIIDAEGQGIYLEMNDDDIADKLIVRNNMISILGSIDPNSVIPSVGIHIEYITDWTVDSTEELEGKIQHNSIYLKSDIPNSAGIRLACETGQSFEVTSNSVKIVGDNLIGLDYENSLGTPWPYSDYNNVFRLQSVSGNSTYGVYTNRPEITLWTGMEAHSINGNPKYYSNIDLHIFDSSANMDKALINADVPLDYDKDPRQYYDPEYDIGADELLNLGWKSNTDQSFIPHIEKEKTFSVFPNPAVDAFTVQFNNIESAAFQLFNSEGRLVLNGIIRHGQQIRMDELAAGVYILRLPELNTSQMMLKADY
jgi:hypothetical protein